MTGFFVCDLFPLCRLKNIMSQLPHFVTITTSFFYVIIKTSRLHRIRSHTWSPTLYFIFIKSCQGLTLYKHVCYNF